jgi:hypothetical protein
MPCFTVAVQVQHQGGRLVSRNITDETATQAVMSIYWTVLGTFSAFSH